MHDFGLVSFFFFLSQRVVCNICYKSIKAIQKPKRNEKKGIENTNTLRAINQSINQQIYI